MFRTAMSERDQIQEDEAELRFLEGVRRRCPDDDRVWRALGELYTRLGRFEEGLVEDQKLVQAFPGQPDVWYNLACSHALLGQIDDAFTALRAAIDRGYGNVEWIQEDEDLRSIRNDPRFQQLLEQMEPNEF